MDYNVIQERESSLSVAFIILNSNFLLFSFSLETLQI